MITSTFYHQPVLKEEALSALDIKPNGTYVDATLGGGGHTRAILEQLSSKGRLLVFDQDEDAWPNAPQDDRVILVRENFRFLKKFLRLYDAHGVDGILADIGVSSWQFDNAERGFSTRFVGDLDMRMDHRNPRSAKTVIYQLNEKQLQEIFEKYGEVRNAKTLAATIVAGRDKADVRTTDDFKALIQDCVMGNKNRYLAQVFQALRIEVNDELGVLQSFLIQAGECMATDGRLCVITFHSLEDRLVKRFLKNGTFSQEVEKDAYGRPLTRAPFKELKSMTAGEEELKMNPRSRSARLRIGVKLDIN